MSIGDVCEGQSRVSTPGLHRVEATAGGAVEIGPNRLFSCESETGCNIRPTSSRNFGRSPHQVQTADVIGR